MTTLMIFELFLGCGIGRVIEMNLFNCFSLSNFEISFYRVSRNHANILFEINICMHEKFFCARLIIFWLLACRNINEKIFNKKILKFVLSNVLKRVIHISHVEPWQNILGEIATLKKFSTFKSVLTITKKNFLDLKA